MTALVQEGEGGEETETQPVMDVRHFKAKCVYLHNSFTSRSCDVLEIFINRSVTS